VAHDGDHGRRHVGHCDPVKKNLGFGFTLKAVYSVQCLGFRFQSDEFRVHG
jgi:hypothetical protein